MFAIDSTIDIGAPLARVRTGPEGTSDRFVRVT